MKKISAMRVLGKGRESQWLVPWKRNNYCSIVEGAQLHLVWGFRRMARQNVIWRQKWRRDPSETWQPSCRGCLAPTSELCGWSYGVFWNDLRKFWTEVPGWGGKSVKETNALFCAGGKRRHLGKCGKSCWGLLLCIVLWLVPWDFSSFFSVVDHLVYSFSVIIYSISSTGTLLEL